MTVPRVFISAVPAVHEDVQQRAEQEQRERQHTERVRSMLRQQEERGDGEKTQQRDIESPVASRSVGRVVRTVHVALSCRARTRWIVAEDDERASVNGA
jgi:hypothetical protein